MLKKTILLLLLLSTLPGFGQIPPGYYDSVNGQTGEDLRTTLYNIIKGHNQQSFSSIWGYFQNTDATASGKVWDMYSDIPGGPPAYIYSFVSDQCGTYSGEGDCFNREHAVPQSWFGGSNPMYTDLFALYPTDGFTNNKRGNFPYGETASPTWTSTNGSSIGPSSYPGYSGTVFEPIDEYKGDFARSYFYMVTRYKDLISGWTSDMFQGSGFTSWAESMLIDWSQTDTVSQKEIDRNNAIYQVQNNRNPFIDHPGWVIQVWQWPAGTSEEAIATAKVWYAENELHYSGYSGMNGDLIIYDALGRKLSTSAINRKRGQLSLSLKPGIYFAVLQTSEANTVLKFIALR